MEYEIVITKREKNPDYDPSRTWSQNIGPFIEHRVLTTVVTDIEFKAVKKACLEVM